MNNEEKILSALGVVIQRLDGIDGRLDGIDGRLDNIEADIIEIKEDAAVTRYATNQVVEWTEAVSTALNVPPLSVFAAEAQEEE